MFEGKLPDIQYFQFIDNPRLYEPLEAFARTIPEGILSKGELFKALYLHLVIPRYFQFTWDSLLECFQHFDWIEYKDISIIHLDLPRMKQDDVLTYLDLLITTAKTWQQDDRHNLTIVFPETARAQIEKLLRIRK